jgi:hypothetical protein
MEMLGATVQPPNHKGNLLRALSDWPAQLISSWFSMEASLPPMLQGGSSSAGNEDCLRGSITAQRREAAGCRRSYDSAGRDLLSKEALESNMQMHGGPQGFRPKRYANPRS